MFDWSLALKILPILAEASVVTVFITAIAFLLSLAGGLPLVLLRKSRVRSVARATAFFIEFVRNTPLLVQLFFLYFVLPGIGIVLTPVVTGVIGLTVHYSCYMSEVYRAGLEAVPRGQSDAAIALNFSRLETFRSIILPQAIPPIVPAAGNYLIFMFKESPLLAFISVRELMFVSSEIGADRFQYLEPITICGLLFLVMSLVSAQIVRIVEQRIGHSWRRR